MAETQTELEAAEHETNAAAAQSAVREELLRAARGETDGDAEQPGAEAGQEDSGAGEGDQEEQQAEAPQTLGNLEALAERAGIPVEELYEIHVPLQDGVEPMKLGDLKNKVADAERIISQGVALQEQREAFESDMLRGRQELNAIISRLPEVPDELVQEAANQYNAHVGRERQALLGIKPEWSDNNAFNAAQDEIMAVAEKYGFTRSDLNTVLDHRLMLLLHGFATLQQRYDAKREEARAVIQGATPLKPAARQTGGRQSALSQTSQALQERAKGDNATDADKRAGVAALLLEAANRG